MSFARSKWGGFHVLRDPPLSPVPFTNRLLKNLVVGCSKRPSEARRANMMSVFLYVDAKSVERNEAYESLSAAC